METVFFTYKQFHEDCVRCESQKLQNRSEMSHSNTVNSSHRRSRGTAQNTSRITRY